MRIARAASLLIDNERRAKCENAKPHLTDLSDITITAKYKKTVYDVRLFIPYAQNLLS